MAKPIKPQVIVPAEFAINGSKSNFSDEKIENGFDRVAADVLAGDNLNKFIDDTYKSITYSNAGVADLYKSAVVYDSSETYNTNSLVFYIDGSGNTTFYRSLIDNNSGNAVSDTSKWVQIQLGEDILNLTQPIGAPILLLSNTLPDGLAAENSRYILLRGQAISRTTYADLFSVYGTTYGSGNGSTTFNVPNYTNRYLYCDTSLGYISAGIPNLGLSTVSSGAHTHKGDTLNVTGTIYSRANSNNGYWGTIIGSNGVFSSTQRTKSGSSYAINGSIFTNTPNEYRDITTFSTSGKWSGSTSSSGSHTHTISTSNSLYGASNTVQVAGVKHIVCTRWR